MPTRQRRVAGTAAAIAAFVLIGGVAVQLTTTTLGSSSGQDEQIGTGTAALALDSAAGIAWTQDIKNLADGDSVERFVDLRNTGSLDLGNLTIDQTNTLGELLTNSSDVSITIAACSVSWNRATGACPTGSTDALATTSLRAWGGQARALDAPGDFTSGQVRHFKITTFAAAASDNTLQGKSGTITYTFSGTYLARTAEGASAG